VLETLGHIGINLAGTLGCRSRSRRLCWGQEMGFGREYPFHRGGVWSTEKNGFFA